MNIICVGTSSHLANRDFSNPANQSLTIDQQVRKVMMFKFDLFCFIQGQEAHLKTVLTRHQVLMESKSGLKTVKAGLLNTERKYNRNLLNQV